MKYTEYEPDNGWGSVEGALKDLSSLAQAIKNSDASLDELYVRWWEMMRYQIILEFDEDWIIDVVMRMLQEKGIDCFYHVIDTEEMEVEEWK